MYQAKPGSVMLQFQTGTNGSTRQYLCNGLHKGRAPPQRGECHDKGVAGKPQMLQAVNSLNVLQRVRQQPLPHLLACRGRHNMM